MRICHNNPNILRIFWIRKIPKPFVYRGFGILKVGVPGLEPGKAGPESAVLPLHHTPNCGCNFRIAGAKVVFFLECTKIFGYFFALERIFVVFFLISGFFSKGFLVITARKMRISTCGRSFLSVATCWIRSTTSSPSTTSPKTVY